jgi:hypothetical protein
MTIPRILIGTESWIDKSPIDSGLFCPSATKTADERLRYYATQFPAGGSGQRLLCPALGPQFGAVG